MPVIIGVGEAVNHFRNVKDAVEPLYLILSAIRDALTDTGIETKYITSQVDSFDIVRTWTWPYVDLAKSLADELGCRPSRLYNSEHGGNQPAYLLDAAARRITKGETNVAILAGGEALASLSSSISQTSKPPPHWSNSSNTLGNTSVDSVRKSMSPASWESSRSSDDPDLGKLQSITNPIHIYPLYEAAFRALRGQSLEENTAESAQLYASFSEIASKNPFAWMYGKTASADEIATVGKHNRMICAPYPLLMNALNNVNLAAACILASTDVAAQLGVDPNKWIYPLGGAGMKDEEDFWKRASFSHSIPLSRSLDAGLIAAGLTKIDIDIYDFYSCFPIVPKLACHHLGLDILHPAKPITVLGGLTSFGGAGNNYSMHAIAEVTRRLRAGSGKNALILANGGVLSYENVVILSTNPRQQGTYPHANLLDGTSVPKGPAVETKPDGEGVVETYTVEYGRDGSPKMGFVVGRMKGSGNRFVANHEDEKTLREMCVGEQVGRVGKVRVTGDGRAVWSFVSVKVKL
ncbi:hypothetical protein K470DRAFT_218419 [Piedraia hortae CBS 480.64]|uniref:Thiolase-like protein type 1 additional C-terminal domain-containing protein n=1 Tax=Piedraia hortae CBS 480.64 TaxID=1314780 RepID=A0A6A7BX58_9PEZI|nr:hypothetical protein K470DRAFT_218419 [Piedraia hortae CBS 480.64]